MNPEPNTALLAELGQIGSDLGKIENKRQLADLAQRLQVVSIGVGRALANTDERVPVLDAKVADLERRLGFEPENGSRLFAGVATAAVIDGRDAILRLFINDCAGLTDIPFAVDTVVAEVVDGDLNITMEVRLV